MKKNQNIDMTNGPMLGSLIRLAMPIMLTGFVQMAYNMTDMFWIGRNGADYVAAVGAAGNFVWIVDSILLIAKVGGQAKIGQSIGAKDIRNTRDYIKTTLQLSTLISIIMAMVFIFLSDKLIAVYRFKSEVAISSAISYMEIVGLGLLFYSSAKVMASIFSALGNTRTGLIATGIGLFLNMILDPLLIFIFEWGVNGAAIATVVSQFVVFIVFFIFTLKQPDYFKSLGLTKSFDKRKAMIIAQIGAPSALNMSVMAIVGLILGGIISAYGAFAVAAQKIGSQIEAISWMTAEGFSVASNSMVAQNYGAMKFDRIKRGFSLSIRLMLANGVITTFIIIFFSREIMSLFLSEPQAIDIGQSYLVIMGYSQIAMCIELVIVGALAGLGKTLIPSIFTLTFSSLRIPLAIFLTSTSLGVDGVWWAITISSIFKGLSIYIIYRLIWRRNYAKNVL